MKCSSGCDPQGSGGDVQGSGHSASRGVGVAGGHHQGYMTSGHQVH